MLIQYGGLWNFPNQMFAVRLGHDYKKCLANNLSIDLLISDSQGPSMFTLSIDLLTSDSHGLSMYTLSIDLLISNSQGPSMYTLSMPVKDKQKLCPGA